MIRPSKDITLSAIISLVPQYTEILRDLQESGGRIPFPPEVASIQDKVGGYVKYYENEKSIGVSLFMALMGEDGFKEFNSQISHASLDEQQEIVNQFASDDVYEEMLDHFSFPESQEDWVAAKKHVEALPEDERNVLLKRSGFFWGYFFSNFFNTLSLMVHGVKLTDLVPHALAGDSDAFLKAVQIDRMLLLHHPFFRNRKIQAQDNGESEFLSKLAYRESNPPLRGKIKYPGLFMLFGTLEAFQWLHDLKHEEILDLCDQSQLDRYQNRIEDVNYLTKRLIEYRRWQKTGGVSMH